LVDFSCEAEVGGEDAGLDVFVVPIDEISNGEGGLGVVGAHGVVEAVVLFEDPGQSAFLNEDVLGQFSQNGGVEFIERFACSEIFGQELGP